MKIDTIKDRLHRDIIEMAENNDKEIKSYAQVSPSDSSDSSLMSEIPEISNERESIYQHKLTTKEIEDLWETIITSLSSEFGVPIINHGNKVFEWHVEIQDDTMGSSWINISYNQWDEKVIIERYYESEFLQDEFGTTIKIPVNTDNLTEEIRKKIGKIQISAGYFSGNMIIT
jgi:hypothetical protein